MSIDPERERELESHGYVVTTAAEWLGLSRAESDYIDIALDLRYLVRFARERAGLTQAQAARRLKSSQSRVSKMEAGDPSVSLDLLISSALALGATRQEVAAAVAGSTPRPDTERPSAEPEARATRPEIKRPRSPRPAKAA